MKKGSANIILIILLVVASFLIGSLWTRIQSMKKDKVENLESSKNEKPNPSPREQQPPKLPKIIGDFLVTDKEICKENGKPLVYFFGLSSCPHCIWEKPIAKEVFEELFANEINYHENFDSQKDDEVFGRYSDINPGYVPFLVLGCKYVRTGSGENLGKTEEESKKLEKEALTVILCKLTGSKPSTVCQPLKEKISEIK